MSAQAANSFLQGLMGGANFVDTLQSRAAEREWQKTERDHKLEEWGREKQLRSAQAEYQEQAWRSSELTYLYNYAKNNLKPDQQRELLHYATSEIFNETEPDLVNHGSAPGETKKMLPPKFVKGGIVPQVGVYDKDGKMIRQGHLTQDRTDGTPPMVADGSVIPEYFIKSMNGRKALAKLRAKIAKLGGKPPAVRETFQQFYDKNGNLVQKSSTGEMKLVAAAKKGKGSGSGGMKNMQFFPNTDTPFQMQVGMKDGEPIMKDAINRTWFDPNSGKFFKGTFVDGALRGKATDITASVQGVNAAGTDGGGGLNTDIDGKEAPKPKPKPDGGKTPAKVEKPSEPSTPASRAKVVSKAGGVVAAKAKDLVKQFDKPSLTVAQLKKAKRLAKDGKWEEVSKILPPDKVKQLRKQFH